MRHLIVIFTFLPAFGAGPATGAQLYKWVDEKGVVTYSNQLPVNPKDANKLALVEDRVSVYTPDAALLQAIEAERRNGASRRVAELEQQLDAERRARQYAAAAATTKPSCPGGFDHCSDLHPYYPYYTYYTGPFVGHASRLRPPKGHIPRPTPLPAGSWGFRTKSLTPGHLAPGTGSGRARTVRPDRGPAPR